MCLGVPMKVLSCSGLIADCSGRSGMSRIDLALVGSQPPGTWLLSFLGAAREVIDAERARVVGAALDALDALQDGQTDLAGFFADLDREPQLPDFLKKEAA